MVVEKEKYIEEIQELKQFLSNKTQEELNGILAYGEEIKARGEKRKREFWLKHGRNDFLKLLGYMEEHEDEIEFRYEYLEEMSDVEKEKFIEEYLFDDVLYSFDGDFDDLGMYGSTCSYLSLKEEKVEIEKGMTVVFRKNEIGAEGAEAMAKCLKLKEGVCLDLRNNQIGAEGAKVISKMKLKEGVILGLGFNKIGDGGAKAISQMELKEGVKIDLHGNKISRDMEEELRKWVESYKAKGINCKVEF